ncbi:MAG: hypothetical protein KY391_00410 [Actinobacteria bacterium]|nr:hypothetical protein [Actinomycetota bacterium]
MRLILCVAMLAVSLAAVARAETTTKLQDDAPPGSFELVGHDPLMNRGMNAALAVRGDYAYVGSRTDGKEDNANNAGVLVVSVKDPAKPEVVHQIGPPHEGNTGETSREMRIWQSKNILIVMNLFSNCSELIHGCTPASGDDNFRFYDISGKKAAEPKFMSEYVPSENPHEFYLWEDPKNPKRALMFMSTPGGNQQALVADISAVPSGGKVKELAKWSALIPGSGDNRLHSMAVTPDGKVGHMSYLQGGFFLTDTSDFAANRSNPKIKELTPIDKRVHWGGPGAHSGVPMIGKPYALTSDEVYGEALAALGHGCPWGWVRTVNIKNPKDLKVAAEYKLLPYNDPSYCQTSDPKPSSSYSSHNPTLTKNLALVSWHSGGLQAIDISNPEKPTQAAEFLPAPLPAVLQEDPALSAGQDKVVVWSFPIIEDGLVYVTDIRNGLYILKYKGPFASEISTLDFLEGNSNLGDAMRLWSGGGGGGGGSTSTGGTKRGCTIVGKRRGDILRGTDGADIICGRGGRDVITGARGNDIIRGGPGNDKLKGNRGRDRIFGGRGRDVCFGGPGRDRIRSCKGSD